jgi:hypothetical protein
VLRRSADSRSPEPSSDPLVESSVLTDNSVAMANSHQIGKKHEDQVENLLQDWRVRYERKKKYKTNQGTIIELDFWLPSTNCRPAIVIECKTFGVEAKNPADSRRRKAQESMYLLIQVRRHCRATQDSRIIIVTGQENFLSKQVELLKAELGPDFHVVSVEHHDQFRNLLE